MIDIKKIIDFFAVGYKTPRKFNVKNKEEMNVDPCFDFMNEEITAHALNRNYRYAK